MGADADAADGGVALGVGRRGDVLFHALAIAFPHQRDRLTGIAADLLAHLAPANHVGAANGDNDITRLQTEAVGRHVGDDLADGGRTH